MIYIRPEGCQIRNGLNIYPLFKSGSLGFILRFGDWVYRVRRSKKLGQWLVGRLYRSESDEFKAGPFFPFGTWDEFPPRKPLPPDWSRYEDGEPHGANFNHAEYQAELREMQARIFAKYNIKLTFK